MATIVGDVTGLQQGHHTRLSTKGKMVLKYCNISKTPGKGSIHPPPPPPPPLDTELEILEETGNRVFKTEVFSAFPANVKTSRDQGLAVRFGVWGSRLYG